MASLGAGYVWGCKPAFELVGEYESTESLVKPDQYSMSFTTGTLLHQESVKLAELYLEDNDWNSVRDRVLDENLLQTRTVKTSKTVCRVIISRLKTLAPPEMELLVHGSTQEQGYLLWMAICRRHAFIAEFGVEVLRERYISLKTDLPQEEFDAFFNRKSDWHPELDEIRPSTRAKLRQVLFKILREADLLTPGNTIHAALLTPALLEAIPPGHRQDVQRFPVFESDLRR